jgi:hypothetical protein
MSLGSALRTSISDFYFNSWRLAPANLVWGLGLALALLAGPSVLAAAILVTLSLPVVGLHRMAALIARGEPAAFSDFAGGMRRFGAQALGVGVAAAILAAVFITNVGVGLAINTPFGWLLSALALHGLVALAMFLVAFWPILADPRREQLDLRARLALAGLMVIGRPGRLLGLTVAVGSILVVSIVLFAAILLVSGAYVSLLATRYVLPIVDELEARLPRRRLLQGGLEPEDAAPSPEGSRHPASPS